MSPEKWVNKVLAPFRASIEAATRLAVEAEREACAQIADVWAESKLIDLTQDTKSELAAEIAAAIRNRV